MKASLVLALLGACTQPAFAVVQFPFARHVSSPRDVASRASKPRAVDAEVFMGAMTYVVNVTVGTPGQPVSLVLSSSSSDTWVKDTRSSDCTYSSSYYGSTYDSDSYYSESTEMCIWGSCKSCPVQIKDPPDHGLGSVLLLGLPARSGIDRRVILYGRGDTVSLSRC
jgi:hypothetical protein